MNALPPVDLHAHVDVAIAPEELSSLGVVFAATRSLDEAEVAMHRRDNHTIWGVGCHPGLVGAHKKFDRARFHELIDRTAFVSETGLDGGSRVPMETQQQTLRAVLDVLRESPRIASLHSYRATALVLDELEAQPIKGAILHWWLGNAEETRRALDLGCFFSVNSSSVRRKDLLDLIPLARVITETDHPFGDRRNGRNARPGRVENVEEALAHHHRCSQEEIRAAIWRNLADLTTWAGCASLLPGTIRLQLAAA